MYIQDEKGNIRESTLEDDSLVLRDLKQGDVFSYYNDEARRIFIMGPDNAVLDINGSKTRWNDDFVMSDMTRVIWYKDARILLGAEYTTVGNGRGKKPSTSKVVVGRSSSSK